MKLCFPCCEQIRINKRVELSRWKNRYGEMLSEHCVTNHAPELNL